MKSGRKDRGVVEERVELCRALKSSVRIGVVGHRTNRLTADDLLALDDRISGTLETLQRAIREQHAGDHVMRPEVVTSLADGADRVVARKAVELGLLEIVVLPFPRSRFEQDFQTGESLVEFRELLDAAVSVIEPASAPRAPEDGYVTASSVIVECADLLMAVWDGRPGRGAGGTAHTVDKALQRGMPVIWVGSQPPYSIEVLRPAHAPLTPILAAVVDQVEAVYGIPAQPGPPNETESFPTLVR